MPVVELLEAAGDTGGAKPNPVARTSSIGKDADPDVCILKSGGGVRERE